MAHPAYLREKTRWLRVERQLSIVEIAARFSLPKRRLSTTGCETCRWDVRVARTAIPGTVRCAGSTAYFVRRPTSKGATSSKALPATLLSAISSACTSARAPSGTAIVLPSVTPSLPSLCSVLGGSDASRGARDLRTAIPRGPGCARTERLLGIPGRRTGSRDSAPAQVEQWSPSWSDVAIALRGSHGLC